MVSLNNARGSCQCGSVEFSVSGEIEAFICHCNDCRMNSGAPFTAWGKINSKSFKLHSGELRDFSSSQGVVWSFCKTCGTGIKYQSTESEPFIDIMLCTLRDAPQISPSYHVQMQEKLAWVEVSDNLPAYKKWRIA